MPTPDQTRANAFATLAQPFDVLVIGGGATGLGIALDAATRNLRTVLIEAGDFAQATSSRATKLVHGGVRYLASGQVHLVYEALHERAVMLSNAPHLVHPLPTLLPATHLWELPWYGAGLTLYDKLSGSSTMGPTKILGKKAAAERIPGIAIDMLKGGILYHDAQFNDARYALALAQTAIDRGATVLNYTRVVKLLYTDGKVSGATVRDEETGTEHTIQTKAVLNATGIFTDDLRHLDQPARPNLLSVSRGTHIVVPSHFLGGDTAIMVPKTDDGRIIFAIPWQGAVLIGTTDLAAPTPKMEPDVDPAEIDFLLATIAPYLAAPIAKSDILSIFSGLRPLVTGKENSTSKLSREHHIDISNSGMVTVAGGKWTTYRRMAEDTLDFAVHKKLLPKGKSVTDHIPLHGATSTKSHNPHLAEYGTENAAISALIANAPALAEPLDQALPYPKALVVHAVRKELARTVEDVLSRRTRSLLLDARAALRAAPAVAALMAKELNRDQTWIEAQLQSFTTLAQAHYIPSE
jgi:glycerol-3-phosphate dehydrogenase